jgi:hypothetical protein
VRWAGLGVGVASLAPDGEQMPTGCNEGRVALHNPRRANRRVKAFIQTVDAERAKRWAGRSFDAVHLNLAQTGVFKVEGKLVGQVKVGGGEPDDVTSKLARAVQVPDELLTLDGQSPVTANVHERRVAADCSDNYRRSGSGDTVRLTKGGEPVLSVRQVIQRPEQQYRVLAFVGLREGAGIADSCCDAGNPSRGGDVFIDRIDQMHAVPTLHEPFRVNAGAAAHVQDPRRRDWQEPLQQFLGAHALQDAVRPHAQPIGLAIIRDVEVSYPLVHDRNLILGRGHRNSGTSVLLDGQPGDVVLEQQARDGREYRDDAEQREPDTEDEAQQRQKQRHGDEERPVATGAEVA